MHIIKPSTDTDPQRHRDPARYWVAELPRNPIVYVPIIAGLACSVTAICVCEELQYFVISGTNFASLVATTSVIVVSASGILLMMPSVLALLSMRGIPKHTAPLGDFITALLVMVALMVGVAGGVTLGSSWPFWAGLAAAYSCCLVRSFQWPDRKVVTKQGIKSLRIEFLWGMFWNLLLLAALAAAFASEVGENFWNWQKASVALAITFLNVLIPITARSSTGFTVQHAFRWAISGTAWVLAIGLWFNWNPMHASLRVLGLRHENVTIWLSSEGCTFLQSVGWLPSCAGTYPALTGLTIAFHAPGGEYVIERPADMERPASIHLPLPERFIIAYITR